MDSIEAIDLSAAYGNVLVWEGASFVIGTGEFVGILGPNGAGKTTLFRLLLGLESPRSGKLLVFGAPPKRGNPRIGYVPQRHQIDTEINIESLEIVRLGASDSRLFDTPARAKESRSSALRALEDVGAAHLAHRPLGRLSGGEQQRVFLAQALAGNPELLLLDEPLASLDMRREREMVELIRSIATSRHVTVLLIAHNINPLLSSLDRVMYAAGGRIAAGNPDDVLTSESLSKLYDAPIEVLRDSRGRIAIVGAEEGAHHHQHE